jgi:RNA polymerase sigma-70 factor (ECF subfamily)
VINVDELLLLHRALLDDNPRAPERFLALAAPRLHAILKRRHATLPREIVLDAATDALLFLVQHPERFQSGKGTLLNFLVSVADNKLRDALRTLIRKKEIYVGGSVELALVEANHRVEGDTEGLEFQLDPDVLPLGLARLLEETLPDPTDRRIWELVCRGRAETAAYAAILGLSASPLEQQRAEVKRHRDRVVAKVRRRRREFERLLQ